MPRGKALKTLQLIDVCRDILEDIQPATVRAVCYQLFVRKVINSMAKSQTNRVSTQLTYAREEGVIPWDWIVDETRDPARPGTWADPEDYADAVQASYRRDRWTQQRDRVEVWSEKGTVRGTLAPVLRAYGVTFRVMHGYGSATAIHDVAEETIESDQPLVVYYVGDRDPSGMHMSDVDLPARLKRYGGSLYLYRLALLPEDVGSLPSFSVEEKRGDPRYRWFKANYGSQCWELDAMNPNNLREKVEEAITDHIAPDAWNRAEMVEKAERQSLIEVLTAWRQATAAI